MHSSHYTHTRAHAHTHIDTHIHTHTHTHTHIHTHIVPENCVSVCNFQYMKSLVELNSLFLKFFCYTSCLMRRTTGGLANEGFTSNHIVSLTQ